MGAYIIVERGIDMQDRGVFTGQIQIADVPAEHWCPSAQLMDGVWSADIEHAFLFNSVSTAYRYADAFNPHWSVAAGRFFGWPRWIVRGDLDFHPGEIVARQVARPEIGSFMGLWDLARKLHEKREAVAAWAADPAR